MPPSGPWDSRPRLGTFAHRQRARHRSCDRRAPRGVQADAGRARRVASFRGWHGTAGGDRRDVPRPGQDRRDLRVVPPSRTRPAGARLHAHDDRPDHRPRRHEAERDPRSGGTGPRREDPARPDRGRRSLTFGRGYRGPGRQGRDRVGPQRPCQRVAGRHAAVGRARRHGQALPPRGRERALLLHGRHRRTVLPPARGGRVRLRHVLRQARVSTSSCRCSTATTNASTSSHSPFPPRCSRLCPGRFWPEPGRLRTRSPRRRLWRCRCRAKWRSGSRPAALRRRHARRSSRNVACSA